MFLVKLIMNVILNQAGVNLLTSVMLTTIHGQGEEMELIL